jgi:predicted permease
LGDLEERERLRRTRGEVRRWKLAADAVSLLGWGLRRRIRSPWIDVAPHRGGARGRGGRALRWTGGTGWTSELARVWRALRRRPGYAAAVVATLALGAGTVAAAFAVVDGIVLRPLPFPEPDRLARVYRAEGGERELDLTMEQVLALAESPVAGAGLGAFSRAGRTLAVPGGEAHNVDFARVTAGFFGTLGATARLGRLFDDDEAGRGAPVVVLSAALWRRLFAADPAVVGAAVVLDEVPHTVVGVMADGLGLPEDAELWRPLTLEEREDDDPEMVAVARRPAGLSTAAFDERLAAVVEASRVGAPAAWGASTARAVPLRDALVGPVRRPLLVLLAAAGLVLLVAAANAASLQLVRAVERRQDAAVHLALGSSRRRVVGGLLLESLALAVVGWGLGMALAAAALPALAGLAPGAVPRLSSVALDARVAAVVGSITVIATLLGALGPALATVRVASAGLRGGGGGQVAGRLRLGTLRTLVAAQLGLTTVLVVSAGLLSVSLGRLLALPRGFDPEGVLVVPLAFSSASLESEVGLRGFADLLLERVGRRPEASAVALASQLPGAGRGLGSRMFELGDLPASPDADGAGGPARPSPALFIVSPSFFRTARLPILSGRELPEGLATGPTDPAVVSHAFGRAFLGAEPWVGRRFTRADPLRGGRREVEVVGVTRDVLVAPGEAPPAALYLSTADVPLFKDLLVRVASGVAAAAAVAAVHEVVLDLDPGQPVNVTTWLRDELDAGGARTRFQARLMTAFGLLALTLAAVGVYGVAAYGAALRRGELGLRRALGAKRGEVLALVLGRALGTSALGIALGLLGAWAATRLLESLLFQVSPFEPVVYAAGALGLGLVAVGAGLAPALRAARDDGALSRLLREG